MNFLQISRVSFDRVAENIITCLSCGVPRKISWTSRRISEKNCQAWPSQWSNFERHPPEILSKLYDGTYQGHQAFCHIHQEQSVWYFSSSMIGRGSKPWGDLELRRQYEVDSPSMFSCPCRLAYHRKIQQPKKWITVRQRCVDPWYGRAHTLRFSMYFENLWYSFEIWKASSRVWHMTNTWGPPELSAFSLSNCCNVAKTKTAVLPIPDLAWQTTSIPVTAWGIHSFWT